MKNLPTVVACGANAIALLEFQGRDRVPNRDAVGFYYYVKLEPDRDVSRVAVIFSGTVMYVDTSPFGLPAIADKTARFTIFAEAALGDFLASQGLPDFTPSGVQAFQVECFSPHFQSWADRPPSTDDEIEQHLREHVFSAWRFALDGWELGLSDLLRLRRPMAFVERLVTLGEGRDWEVLQRGPQSVRLRGLPDFVRRQRESGARPRRASPGPPSQEAPDVPTDPADYVFVDEVRVAELKGANASKFDVRKVIALCEELNICYRSQCYHAVAALTRALLDHVPPIFGCNTFAEVANNYSGGKSFRDCMVHLENAARRIGDMHLHTKIRQQESLPTRTQVNFAPEVDMLLAEVARVLGAH